MAEIAFRVLGPLEVSTAWGPVSLGGRKPRILLATLLLEPNTVVAVDALVDVLWPDSPPRSAVANVRTYAHSLRTALGGRMETRRGGYRLAVGPGELDMALFEAEPDPCRALALWRGRVLADLPHSPVWEPTVARLEELRLQVIEQSLTTRIADGEHEDTIAELRGLLAEHPLREQLWRRLILALHGSGRTAEALRAYADVERILATELGTSPGQALRDTRQSIGAAEVYPVCQLPLDIPDFTGRTGTVHEVTELLAATPVVVTLTGPPGAGKSTMAVHIGHAVRYDFPDGQLYVTLRGNTPTAILAELLGALGVTEIPRTLPERAARYRSILARRKLLLILDDADNAAQVAPLLPGTGGCAVLVTSRTRMPDLSGAIAVPVGAFTEAEARLLLARIAGPQRVAEEPDNAAWILRACGYLPLAIRVAGAKLAARPAVPLRVLADRLRDERVRLDELSTGGLTVRSSFADGYDRLSPAAARAFRLAGLLGPVRFPGWTIAALLDRPRADDVLDTLVDAGLLEVTGVDATGQPRYRLPDLFRCYAGERLAAEPMRELRAATRRVLGRYLTLATDAAARMPVPFFGVLPGHGSDTGDHSLDPVAWFEAERHAVIALLDQAARLQVDEQAWRIPAAYAPYFDLRGHHDDWQRTHEMGLRSALRAGDDHGRAIVLRNLGQLNLYQDRYAEAEAAMTESLRLFAEAGDDRGAGIALAGLGTTLRVRGDYRSALAHHHHALRIFVRAGERNCEAAARIAIGTVLLAQHHFPPAEKWLTDARTLSAEIGDRHREAHALQRMASLRRHQGDTALALNHLAEATATFQDLGDDHCVAYARQNTGELCLRNGDHDRARQLLTESLDAHTRTGDRRSAAEVTRLLDELG